MENKSATKSTAPLSPSGGQTKTMLNLDTIRTHFPALASQTIYFDNPGGTQVAQEALQHISHYLQYTNANHGGQTDTAEQLTLRKRGIILRH